MLADIGPGHLVFESGVGSGALSMTMLRAGARIIGYELREDFAQRAKKNVASFLGDDASARFDVVIRDSYLGIDVPASGRFDRAVLDLPEPWQVVPHLSGVMQSGGVMVAYTPSITQAVKVTRSLVTTSLGNGSECEPSKYCIAHGISKENPFDPIIAWWPTRVF